MGCLKSISPVELTLLAIALGLVAIAVMDKDELNVIGNWFIGIGGIMVIDATQAAYLEGLSNDKSREAQLNKKIEILRNELDSLARSNNSERRF